MRKFHLTRRTLLIGITSAFAAPAFAGGDSGGGLNKNPNVKDRYSQREFVKLSSNEIRQLYFNFTQKRGILIEGFSPGMSNGMVIMTHANRRRAQRLMREMRKLKDKEKRLKRLRMEIKSIDDELVKLISARKRALSKGFKNAVKETEERMANLNRYRVEVRTWIRFSHQGTQ